MDDIAAKLRDYGLTLQESVVICDRRVVDEAATLIEAFEEDSIANKSRLAHMRRQEDEIRDLKAERDALRSDNARLAKGLEEARKALEPFAKFKTADGLSCGFLRIPDEHPMLFNGLGNDVEFVITVGDFRRAAAIRYKATVTTDDLPEGGRDAE